MKIPKIETLIIVVFLGSVLLWGISKCSAKRAQLADRDKKETDDERPPAKRDTVFVPQQKPVLTQPSATPQPVPQASSQPPGRTPQLAPTDPQTSPAPAKSPGTSAPATNKYPTLYVTIDGLKVRKEPGLKGDAVTKLELYQPVFFLNQKTEWTQEISLGTEKVTDHWVKIRTASGKEGWVFGAGVHYYKMKRKGVLE